MLESRVPRIEKELQGKMNITVLGPSCSGKTTLLAHLRESGMTVHPEPDNEIFQLFIKNPHKFGYLNQLNLSTRLMVLEAQNDATGNNSPHFIESGVLATDIYNRYLRDQGHITTEEFTYLNWMYKHHLSTHPKPDLVVYLSAEDEELKKRSVMRDGAVALEPSKLQPYWDRLVREIENNGVTVLKINTSIYSPVEVTHMLLQEMKNLRPNR